MVGSVSIERHLMPHDEVAKRHVSICLGRPVKDDRYVGDGIFHGAKGQLSISARCDFGTKK